MISAHIDHSQAGESSDRLKASLCSEPSLIDPGLHHLDSDLHAGPAGSIDLVMCDRAGSLVLVTLAGRPPDDALLRLIDQYSWALDQRGLLERLYASRGVHPDRPIRALLIAPALSPAFMRRLSLLNFDMTAYLARPVEVRGESTLVVEPAAALFDSTPAPSRFEESMVTPRAVASGFPAGAVHRDREPAVITRTRLEVGSAQWPAVEPVLDPPEASRGIVPPLPEVAAEPEVAVANESQQADRSDRETGSVEFPADLEPAASLETLTTEELEEFARFDRMRRGREGEAP